MKVKVVEDEYFYIRNVDYYSSQDHIIDLDEYELDNIQEVMRKFEHVQRFLAEKCSNN